MILKYFKDSDIVVVEHQKFEDDRGFFFERQKNNFFLDHSPIFIQENHAFSKRDVLRGLHYQTKNPQGKFVSVVSGEILDVCVDLRKSSINFGKHFSFRLSSDNNKSIYVPPGYAHGYQVVSDTAYVIYSVTDIYNPKYEKTLLWNDSKLNIKWVESSKILVSEKDKLGDSFEDSNYFD